MFLISNFVAENVLSARPIWKMAIFSSERGRCASRREPRNGTGLVFWVTAVAFSYGSIHDEEWWGHCSWISYFIATYVYHAIFEMRLNLFKFNFHINQETRRPLRFCSQKVCALQWNTPPSWIWWFLSHFPWSGHWRRSALKKPVTVLR